MNILHHKSYHVYNKKNIEKVRKDEQEAAEKEKQKQKRIDLAESEVRLNLLREKAGVNYIQDKPTEKMQHINLFPEASSGNNEEHEKEEKEKAKQLEDKFTMYLGGNKEQKEVPWYAKNSDKYKDLQKSKPKRKRRRSPIRLRDDPLKYIEHKLGTEKKKKKKPKKLDDEKSSKKSQNGPTMEELRARRIEREKKERQRTKELYLGPAEDNSNDEPAGYNSQYNRKETLLAKQNKRRRY
ncbi:hypothetical protein BY458DRAFT_591372 [Sporodiniella umbellata]|nr:hypothetical protein BY458DRAFT_591372 [Sporodiniella umbellata]